MVAGVVCVWGRGQHIVAATQMRVKGGVWHNEVGLHAVAMVEQQQNLSKSVDRAALPSLLPRPQASCPEAYDSQ